MRLLLFLFLSFLAVSFVFSTPADDEDNENTPDQGTSVGPEDGDDSDEEVTDPPPPDGDNSSENEEEGSNSSKGTTDTETETTTEVVTSTEAPEPPPPSTTAPPPPPAEDDPKFELQGKDFEKYTSQKEGKVNWQVGIHQIKETSFRIRLGTPDLCSHVIVCNGYTNTTDSGTLTFDQAELCKKKIVFNLKDKTVKLNDDQEHPFGLSVADFINHENKLKLVLTKQIVTSNVVNDAQNGVTEEVELDWTPAEDFFYTIVGSGRDCPGIVHTFKRGTYDRYYLKETDDYEEDDVYQTGNHRGKQPKKAILPLHGGLVEDLKVVYDSEFADQCRISYLGETGVTKMGDFITVPADEPVTFKYNLAVGSGDLFKNAPKRLQLEIKDPEKCEWVRLCFENNPKSTKTCSEKDKVLDLVFRHRFYVPLDDDYGRLFDMPVNELDTFTFTFSEIGTDQQQKKVVSMETKPVSHGDPLKHTMNLDWEMKNDAVIYAAASKCTFRLTRVDPEKTRDVSYKEEDEYTRFNGFITNCGQVVGKLTSVY